MDFASLMKKELSKTKGGSSDTSKKFLKQSEVEEQRKAAYLAEQRALEEERQRKAAAKRKREDEIAAENAAREEKRRKLAEESRKLRQEKEEEEERQRRKRLGLPELAKPKNGENTDGADENDVPEEELQKGLRAIGEPYIVFGESHAARMRRYKRLTTVMSAGPIPTTLALVEEKDMRVDGTVPKDKQGRQWLFRQLASYFTMVLAAYERAMDEERNDTGASKQAYATMVQTRENMKPLFRRFESGDLDDSLIEPIVQIVKALQERRYVDANDDYLRLSIGKAAWPIGVTMVGIHERSAREKLHNGEKGHVMGDEVTRKFLQSIKRCLTFAQVRWPPTDLRQLMG